MKNPYMAFTNKSLMLLSADTIAGFASAVKESSYQDGKWLDDESKTLYHRWKNTAAALKKNAPSN